jgi:hypothetical protein
MKQRTNQQGTVMIALMIFMVIGITITAAAVGLAIDATVTSSAQISGESTLAIAESGAENAILRILRDPTYTGETFTVGSGTAVVTVTGSSWPKIIRSEGQLGTYSRAVQVTVDRISGELNILTWEEVPVNP